MVTEGNPADLVVTPETEPAEIDVRKSDNEVDAALDLDEADGEGLVEQEPEPRLTHDQRRRFRQREELIDLREQNKRLTQALLDDERPSGRARQRIRNLQAQLNELRETNRKLASDLSRANRTIDQLIDGHGATIAKLRGEVAAMGAQ